MIIKGTKNRRRNRVLFFGKSKAHTGCTRNLVHALAATGNDVRWINPVMLARWLGKDLAYRRIMQIVKHFKPQMIFSFFRDLPLPIYRELSQTIPMVLWVEELLDPIPEDVKERVKLSTLVSVSILSQTEEYKAAGAQQVVFSMSGCGPTHYNQPVHIGTNGGSDVVFLGTPGREGQRADLIREISKHFAVEVIGKNWLDYIPSLPGVRFRREVGPKGYARACQRSGVVLGMNERNDVPLYFSNRIWLTLACGGFHLTHFVPRMEEIFERGGHLNWFSSTQEAVEQISHYLRNDRSHRDQVAAKGRGLVLREHTYENRIRKVLSTLAEEGVDLAL